jgi:hypothetical protein
MSISINNNNIYENLDNPVTFANTPTIKPNENPRAHELKCVNTQKFCLHAFSLCKECIIVTVNYSNNQSLRGSLSPSSRGSGEKWITKNTI